MITVNSKNGIMSRLNTAVEDGIPMANGFSGIPIFAEDDILKVKNPLSVMLRVMFVKNNISHDQLNDKYREYAVNILGEVPSRISTGKSNLLKAIMAEDVSFKKFYEVFVNILGYNLDLTFELVDKSGKSNNYNYVKSIKEVVDGRKRRGK